jgi:hypothetical protein
MVKEATGPTRGGALLGATPEQQEMAEPAART